MLRKKESLPQIQIGSWMKNSLIKLSKGFGMFELFSRSDFFFHSIKCVEPIENWESDLQTLFQKAGLSIEGASKQEFFSRIPIFMITEKGDQLIEVRLLSQEIPFLHHFFFEFCSGGLIEKKQLPILSTQSIRFSWMEDHFYLLKATIELESILETSLVLEGYPDYLAKLQYGLISMRTKQSIYEKGTFQIELNKAILIEKFLKFSSRLKKQSKMDSWLFIHEKLIQVDFCLSQPVQASFKFIVALYREHLKNLKRKEKEEEGNRVTVFKIHQEFQSEFDSKIGIVLFLNFHHQYEVFEWEIFNRLLLEKEPRLVFEKVNEIKEDQAGFRKKKIYYVEFRVALDHPFDQISMKKVRFDAIEALNQSVKQLTLPLFKPRNEEGILKDFVRLSQQLTHPADLPQVIFHFDQHNIDRLSFQVILVRVKKDQDKTLNESLRELKERVEVSVDRVKTIGVMDRQYPKEACVLTFRVRTKKLVREDHTIDFQKARFLILQHLMQVFGPVRDFEGGMLAKQAEAFELFKEGVLKKSTIKLVILENFFYGIYPAEYRSLIETDQLIGFFLSWKKTSEKKEKSFQEGGRFFQAFKQESLTVPYLEFFQENPMRIHEGFWLKFSYDGMFWIGCLVKDLTWQQLFAKKFFS